MDEHPEALLLSGVFGTGKSAVAEEIADILEARGTPYAAIDLDWLSWSNAPGADHDEHALLARNLAGLVANYREAEVRLFVLAGSVADGPTLDAIRAAMAMPVRVVRLAVPMDIIEERLRRSPTRGRADDLLRARAWLADGTGLGLEEAEIENVGPIRDTALRVLAVIGWT
jgi:chloramphenicol 3-O-phosphotransferase